MVRSRRGDLDDGPTVFCASEIELRCLADEKMLQLLLRLQLLVECDGTLAERLAIGDSAQSTQIGHRKSATLPPEFLRHATRTPQRMWACHGAGGRAARDDPLAQEPDYSTSPSERSCSRDSIPFSRTVELSLLLLSLVAQLFSLFLGCENVRCNRRHRPVIDRSSGRCQSRPTLQKVAMIQPSPQVMMAGDDSSRSTGEPPVCSTWQMRR